MVANRALVVLGDSPDKTRYISMPFLNALTMKMAAGAATIIISRAGSMLFEIASWGIPSVIIPIANTNLDHQKKNAFSYAHSGACTVIEEANMTAKILSSEIERIIESEANLKQMSQNAKAFNHPGAAMKIARALVDTALSHEK